MRQSPALCSTTPVQSTPEPAARFDSSMGGSSDSASGSRATATATETETETVPATAPEAGARLGHMPALLYGTAWKGPRTAALVSAAVQAGFRGIDTAAQPRHYDEAGVGRGLGEGMRVVRLARAHVWIQTKFTPWDGQHAADPLVTQHGGVPYEQHAPPAVQVRQSVAQSLVNLCAPLPAAAPWDPPAGKGKARAGSAASSGSRYDTAARADPLDSLPSDWYLDSLVLHSPLRTLPDTAAAWAAMEDLVLEGRVRQLGMSNVHDPRIWALLRTPSISPRVRPTVLQNRWHASTGHDVSILPSLSPSLSPNDYPYSTRHGSPSPSPSPNPGLGTEGEERDALSVPSDAQGVRYQPFWLLTGNPRLLESTPVLTCAAERGMTPEQVVYRFAAQGFGLPGLAVTVLCGATNPVHVAQAVDAVTGPPLQLAGAPLPGLEGVQRHAHPDLDDDTLEAIRREVYGL